MAHIGKQYKLWFRRDFALNVNNVGGYPESMHAALDGIFSSITGHAVPWGGRARNHNIDDPEARTWTLDPFTFEGDTWGGDLTCTNDPNDGNTDWRYRVEAASIGLVLGLQFVNPEALYAYTRWSNFTAPHLLFINPRVFYIPQATAWEPWTWADGP